MTELYPNLCYNEVCYKGTVLYFYVSKQQRMVRLHICAGLSEPSLFAFLISTKVSWSYSINYLIGCNWYLNLCLCLVVWVTVRSRNFCQGDPGLTVRKQL